MESPQPAALVLRLLADRHWRVAVNGQEATSGRWGAALAVNVPSGRSEVTVTWEMDPRATAGAIAAVIMLTWIAARRWRRPSEHHP